MQEIRDSASELLSAVLLRLRHGLQPALAPQVTARAPRGGHRHGSAECFVQIRGRTRFRFPDDELLLERDQLVVLPRGLVHAERAEADADGFRQLVLLPEGPRCRLFSSGSGRQGRPVPEQVWQLQHADAKQWESWLQAAACCPDADCRQGLVLAALAAIRAAWPRDPLPADLVQRCRQLVAQELHDPTLNVTAIARHLGLSADHCSQRFRRDCGISLSRYLQAERLALAKDLLATSRAPVRDIARQVGIRDASWFGQLFARRYGLTPERWRRKHLAPTATEPRLAP